MPGPGGDPELRPGFGDPVADSQSVFREVLAAMSEPGTVRTVAVGLDAPAPLHPATAAVCLALMDFETPVWLDAVACTGAVRTWLRFHCGCPLVADPAAARFAVAADPVKLPPLDGFAAGSEAYPDEGATLVLQVGSLDGGMPVTVTGPGIPGERSFGPEDVTRDFWHQRRALEDLFPQGLDLVFTSGVGLAALPRSTLGRW
ncbi:MAG: phosphonate C-P lyase system protein PhnH [Alphaproteobacteria bacterium]|nr:phosphonate C-P lyase system protein PhnH [Alphaproteobacteria bacterium]